MVSNTEMRVTPSQLKRMLKSMALWKDFQHGNLRCEFCGCLLSQKNLTTLFEVNNHYAAGCNRYACYRTFLGLHEQITL
jgi:hypothetical protein